ncbi:MAG TPA: DNA methyltransferase [Candidatus Sericytochromatia bacterium]
MNQADLDRVETFLERWQGSRGNERANYQLFFTELCDALGVQRPLDKGRVAGDPYCFDKDVKIFHPSGKVSPGFIDFFKAEHFVIEAKQGGTASGKGTAKRGTTSYLKEMEKAFVQAVAYTRSLESKPPFILTCDIGDHFELWQGFNQDYGGYGARQEIPLAHLRKPEVFELFVDIFSNPQKRNPQKIAAQVTREVAADLAELAKRMETQHNLQQVATFLMRCIFTMFAEDVGLLKEKLFTQALETRWLPNPKTFKPEVETLWQAMTDGTSFSLHGRLLRFNGGLFADSTAFELTTKQLEVLLQAAKRDWQKVEPAIFGTLLERALDAKERSKLGAHYTPRSYVERLVRPVVLEPLQERWVEVQAEAKKLLDNGDLEPTAAQKKKAVAVLEGFLQELREVKILDPACGSGNFLYVTLDLLKGLESEVLRRLEDVTGQAQLKLDIDQVNPSQFLGIEINPRASAIADLVIWIGYLKWHFKRFGNIPPVEPVLREYKNIECRDAVLAYDGKELDIDPTTNKPRTRWGGRIIKHLVTGEDVPDPSDQIPIYRYINPRPAVWLPPQPSSLKLRLTKGEKERVYIVSNPPFIGNARMREMLGDGYAETLRKVYKYVPDTVDFVMYWWHKAAELVRAGNVERFGLITTNSIRQARLRSVIEFHLTQKNPLQLIFAIPDHPWAAQAAAVRISMMGAELANNIPKILQLGTVIAESEADNPEETADQVEIEWQNAGQIFSNLRAGVDVTKTRRLLSNQELASQGFVLGGAGFIVSENIQEALNLEIIYPFITGRDLSQTPEKHYTIDANQLLEEELRLKYPETYQWLLENVKPERDINNDPKLRREWWKYRRSNASIRNGIKNLNRYIATTRTAKHRVFQFLPSNVMVESGIVIIFLEDAYFLGVLSSQLHIRWSIAAGGWMGVGNDPVYNHACCFYPFPFPNPTPEQKQKIRDLGERLDAHRKRVQSQHPDVTITGMYNLLEKMRSNEPFSEKDREYNNKALVSTLKQIHDELDAAVFEAYGWQQNLSNDQILEQLVALNAERAEEERNGLIRWLRPEYQAPETMRAQSLAPIQGMIEGLETEEAAPIPIEQQPLPKKFKEQLAAIRDLLRTSGSEWTLEQIVAQFKGATRSKKAISESPRKLGRIRHPRQSYRSNSNSLVLC